MKAIACINKDFGIGYNGQLLCHIKEDMKRFKSITMNKPIIYGANTLKTFPNQKPLKDRINFILTSSVFHIENYKNWNCPVYRINELNKDFDWIVNKEGTRLLEYDDNGISIKILCSPNYSEYSKTRVYIVHSINTLLKTLKILGYYDDAIVCGGESIYKQLIDYCNQLYLTIVDYKGEVDAYFPNIDNIDKKKWTLTDTSCDKIDEVTGLSYCFNEYMNFTEDNDNE